ncbi:hypothetical protein L1887_50695 [Cichorium endivia]|nr:hypothetical protein L1887_50695 [Cichorium endivia]
MAEVAKDAPDGARDDIQSPNQEIPPSSAQSPVKDCGKDKNDGLEGKDSEGANEAEATVASTPDVSASAVQYFRNLCEVAGFRYKEDDYSAALKTWLTAPAHKYRAVHYHEPGLVFSARVLHHRSLPGFHAPRFASSGFPGIVVHRFQIRNGGLCGPRETKLRWAELRQRVATFVPDIKEEDYVVSGPFLIGEVMCYIDILLINPAYHDEFYKINFTTRQGVYFAHHSVGADVLYDAAVLLIKGLDERADPVAVADRIKKKASSTLAAITAYAASPSLEGLCTSMDGIMSTNLDVTTRLPNNGRLHAASPSRSASSPLVIYANSSSRALFHAAQHPVKELIRGSAHRRICRRPSLPASLLCLKFHQCPVPSPCGR